LVLKEKTSAFLFIIAENKSQSTIVSLSIRDSSAEQKSGYSSVKEILAWRHSLFLDQEGSLKRKRPTVGFRKSKRIPFDLVAPIQKNIRQKAVRLPLTDVFFP